VPSAQLRLTLPPELAEVVEEAPLRAALAGVARLAGAGLQIEHRTAAATAETSHATPIQQLGRPIGHVACADAALRDAAGHLAAIVSHLSDRAATVSDMARALLDSYAELNVFYDLLPALATRTGLAEVGRLIVDEATRALRCKRASLLIYDEQRRALTVLAARGLPAEALSAVIPVETSLAGRTFSGDGLLLVDDVLEQPSLTAHAERYDARAFAVIRVPLRAQGHALGVLAVTERANDAAFTPHERRVLECLSAVGAAALLNCRLHAAVERQMVGTIAALASAVDAKDHYTHDHARRVADLCQQTARRLDDLHGLSMREIELAGLLHDIGKIGIPDSILGKAGPLTPDEFELVKSHAQVGARIVAKADGLERVAQAVLHHHERYDGAGYPGGLAGESIPLGARLIAIADAFDCLTSNRPYHRAIPAEAAVAELRRCAGTSFDPKLVEAFAEALAAATSAERGIPSAE
jgi:putative nucleotidyltransferase with HDIG domain